LVERARPEEKAILARTVSTSAPVPFDSEGEVEEEVEEE
jgi:hypothetical protein